MTGSRESRSHHILYIPTAIYSCLNFSLQGAVNTPRPYRGRKTEHNLKNAVTFTSVVTQYSEDALLCLHIWITRHQMPLWRRWGSSCEPLHTAKCLLSQDKGRVRDQGKSDSEHGVCKALRSGCLKYRPAALTLGGLAYHAPAQGGSSLT